MSNIDYDTPRQAAVEEDSLEELQTRADDRARVRQPIWTGP